MWLRVGRGEIGKMEVILTAAAEGEEQAAERGNRDGWFRDRDQFIAYKCGLVVSRGEARRILAEFPAGDARSALEVLVDFVGQRAK